MSDDAGEPVQILHKMVTLRDPKTKEQVVVCAESENIIRIFKSIGYVVVEEAE